MSRVVILLISVFGVVAAACAAVTMLWFQKDASRRAPPDSQLPAESQLPATQSGVQAPFDASYQRALLSKVAELNARVAKMEEGAARRPPNAVHDLARAEQPVSVEEAGRRNQEAQVRIDAVIDAEVRDSVWAAQAEIRLAERLATLEASRLSGPIACKTTICRVVVDHRDKAAQESFMEFASREPMGMLAIPSPGAGTRQSSDVSERTFIYFIRAGADAPEHPVRSALQHDDAIGAAP